MLALIGDAPDADLEDSAQEPNEPPAKKPNLAAAIRQLTAAAKVAQAAAEAAAAAEKAAAEAAKAKKTAAKTAPAKKKK